MAEKKVEYSIQELSGKFAKETRKEWGNQIANFEEDEDVILKSTYESKLEYALDRDTDAIYYGLKGDEGHAVAILELTIKKPETNSSGLRLLNITLEPTLDVENRHGHKVSIKEAIQVIAHSVLHAFNLTFEEIPADTFKIYGRTDRMQAVLENVAESFENNNELSKIYATKMQGRWLLIGKNK